MNRLKKFNLLHSASAILIIVTMSLAIFTGCQSKNATSDKDNKSTSNSHVGPKGSTRERPNADDMKKKMQENIASLVKDGTITQEQADKILEALTANTQKFNGQNKPQAPDQNKQQNNQNNSNNSNNNTNSNGNNGNKNNDQGNKPNRQRNNQLSSLVNDGVITQAQADAVMEKIRGNFNRPQNN